MELNKILERDLKLACLIPTHCTGKASGSYCTALPTSSGWLRLCERGRALCLHGLESSVDSVKFGVGLPLPHFLSLLIMDKEMSWGDRRKKIKKKKDLHSLWNEILFPFKHQIKCNSRVNLLQWMKNKYDTKMKSPHSHIKSNWKRVEPPLHREGKLPETKNPDGLCLYITPLPATSTSSSFIHPTVYWAPSAYQALQQVLETVEKKLTS